MEAHGDAEDDKRKDRTNCTQTRKTNTVQLVWEGCTDLYTDSDGEGCIDLYTQVQVVWEHGSVNDARRNAPKQ